MDPEQIDAALETETLEIDGKQVEARLDKDTNTITIARPEGMTDDEFTQFQKDISEGTKLAPLYYGKLNDLNRRKAELDAETLKVKAEKEAAPATPDPITPADIKPLWQELGLESEDDLEDYAADNPGKFMAAATAHATQSARAEAMKSIADMTEKTSAAQKMQTLENQIRSAGHDPDEVIAFARQNQMPFGDSAYEYYCMVHADKVNPIIEAQIQAQKAHINYVDPTHFRLKPNYKPEELKSLPDAELEALITHAKEIVRSR